MPNRLVILCAIIAALLTAPGHAAPAPVRNCGQDTYDGEKVALVVGTDDFTSYGAGQIPDLTNAGNDANRIADLLRRQNFKVRCLIDPTQLMFEREVQRLRSYMLAREDAAAEQAFTGRVVIYVAGHGFRDPADKGDYLLLRVETDRDKYERPVDLGTLGGLVEQGRHSMAGLVDEFNLARRHQVLVVFDTCRALIKIREQNGTAVRGEQTAAAPSSRLSGNRVIAYSTRPGGVAADKFPSYSEKNGLYTALLVDLLDQAGVSFNLVLTVTAYLVESYNSNQQPEHVNRAALFSNTSWISREARDDCEALNAVIWNSIDCTPVRMDSCLRKDVCPRLRQHLKGQLTERTKACLAEHRQRWLQKDLTTVCSEQLKDKSVPAGPSTVEAAAPNASPVNLNAALLASYTVKPTLDAPVAQSPTGPWATRFEFDQNLLRNGSLVQRLAYANRIRDSLIVKAPAGEALSPRLAAPFSLEPSATPFVVRNLPTIDADPIGTFVPGGANIEIDCQTIICSDTWVGVRVKRDDGVYRGWASARDLKSVTKPTALITLQYRKNEIELDSDRLAFLRGAVHGGTDDDGARRRIQLVAFQSAVERKDNPFLATARLSFLRRALIDSQITPADVVEAVVVDNGSDAQHASITVNLAPPRALKR